MMLISEMSFILGASLAVTCIRMNELRISWLLEYRPRRGLPIQGFQWVFNKDWEWSCCRRKKVERPYLWTSHSNKPPDLDVIGIASLMGTRRQKGITSNHTPMGSSWPDNQRSVGIEAIYNHWPFYVYKSSLYI